MNLPLLQASRLVVILLGAGLIPSGANASDAHPSSGSSGSSTEELVSVNAFTANQYKRKKAPTGEYQAETYAFGEGGKISGRVGDKSIDDLSFNQIARTLAGPLADRQYIPSKNANETDLLILVYWGTTASSAGGAKENSAQHWMNAQSSLKGLVEGSAGESGSLQRDQKSGSQINQRLRNLTQATEIDRNLRSTYQSQTEDALTMVEHDNRIRDQDTDKAARLIGYSDELRSTDDLKAVSGLGPYRGDLLSDIEDDRYFVTLVACDFRAALKTKKIKPLWWARYNLRARGNRFDEVLLNMSRYASRYFGENTHGLVRNVVPIGHVEVGVPTVVETKSDK